ncbi:sporadic carbohydrate cluster protein, LIC12192 family [Candidatus Woesearchaeota archaeon]|jgi:sporadic carbohydrate cluster protein (TIGR04323 family)|nr:sporadic carbohydrate cluster protein, LIC12192 family [Candidatus Woesearchaeota archaeon]
MKKLRGYIFSRFFMGERVPQHVQNLVLRDYCNKVNSRYLLSATEYAMDNSFLVLQQTLNELKEVNGIVAYSLFQMPVKQADRLKIYNKALKLKGELHFAVEGLKITCQSEIDRIEAIWLVKQTLPSCYKYTE